MVAKVIRDYLASGKNKLTVPGFGTFMRRDGGDVVFVDLLRTDDGVLAELVEDTGNYSEVEAMALIDRFIFNARRDIERTGRAEWERSMSLGLQSPQPETVKQEELFTAPKPPLRQPERPVYSRPVQPPRRQSKKTDVIIVIAVIAAAIAIVALAFGLSTGNMPFLQ